MATVAAPIPLTEIHVDTIVLHDVAWETYCQLRDLEANDAVRMTYLDGELTLMSPAPRHDRHAELLGLLIRGVTSALGVEVMGIRSTTLRREGELEQGVGKEADNAFYIGETERRMRRREELDLSVDPPPNLAIEVDHSRNSEAALAIYARLGVPEVWRLLVPERTLIIHRLVGGVYETSERSGEWPKLTPALIVAALDRFDVGDLGENGWFAWIKAWAAGLPEPGGMA